MARAILPDTDVVVDFFRGYEKATLDSFICLFRVIPVDSEIAKAQGGLYKRDYSKSHGVGPADAILAATAESENAE